MFVVGGLIVLPAIEEAEAKNAISESRNKGQEGALNCKGSAGDCGTYG
ncbi:MAG: hypothetical protein K0R16_857 [Nitrososphaeraceae archaeon]|nr:hypothetical protein [Nitrososphaeraceae archaeon]MDF2768772.1 hypothetical protein [Nitrososphaeraceae archaeon]